MFEKIRAFLFGTRPSKVFINIGKHDVPGVSKKDTNNLKIISRHYGRKYKMENKIVIEITDSNKPPKVTIDGKEVKVKDIAYHYESESDIHYGAHELLASIANDEKKQFDKIGFEK